ncbi:hypothetical protein ACDX38_07955 [Pseudomonas aeruginosa]|uniref:hypothetical protein n=1 Tax=Pseudomonas aeruginosa TaxID=287 RepID=UPI0039BDFA27
MANIDSKEIVEIWKAVVGVQMHFNDISMRIRSMFVTILLALFASLGFLLDKNLGLQVADYYVQFATILPVFGILGTYLFYFIDRYWCHRLLVGSVKQGLSIESKFRSELPELSLTDAIGKESPYEPRGFARILAKLIVSDDRFPQTGKLHSDGKVEFFYKSVMVALLGTVILVAIFGGVAHKPVLIEPGAERPIGEASTEKQFKRIESSAQDELKALGGQQEEPKQISSAGVVVHEGASNKINEPQPVQASKTSPKVSPVEVEVNNPPNNK